MVKTKGDEYREMLWEELKVERIDMWFQINGKQLPFKINHMDNSDVYPPF